MRLHDCTFLIKSFLRPHCLARLLLSIHRYYAFTPVIVVDDSGNGDAAQVCAPYPYVRLITTAAKDVGISRGRNIGLAAVRTEFFISLDDDFILCVVTDIPAMKRRLEEVGADIIGGTMIEPTTGRIRQSTMGFLTYGGFTLLVRHDLAPGAEGWVKATNMFLIARTAIRDIVSWPDNIKIMEHGPYFWLAHIAGCKVWASTAASVVHLRDGNGEYVGYRRRVVENTDHEVTKACNDFRARHRFVWIKSQLFEEFGSIKGAERFGWERYIPPHCPSQERLVKLLHMVWEPSASGWRDG